MSDSPLKSELRAAIERYCQTALPNDHALAVLARLTPRDDPDDKDDRWEWVRPVFAATPRDQWSALLYACLRAGQAQREHEATIRRSKLYIEKADRAEKALRDVERFLFPRAAPSDAERVLFPGDYGGPAPEGDDVMAFPLIDESHKLFQMTSAGKMAEEHRRGPVPDRRPWGRRERAALDLLRSRISTERLRAEDERKLRSQKSSDGADRAAGIGLIKAAVLSCLPAAPHRKKLELAAYLATAVLNAGRVSEESVDRAKTPRDWLDAPARKTGRSRVLAK